MDEQVSYSQYFNTLCVRNRESQFLLPAHKADNFFEGNQVLIRSFQSCYFDPVPSFLSYVTSRDTFFPSASPLWLTSTVMYQLVPFL